MTYRPVRPSVLFAGMLATFAGAAAVSAHPMERDVGAGGRVSGEVGRVDPQCFFDQLVARYRGLTVYSDMIDVIQVTERSDTAPQRVETRIACEVRDGELKVATPASQVREGMGFSVPLRTSRAMKDLGRRYDLWLAPHMALKFSDRPLEDLRAGIDEGFTPTGVEEVRIKEKKMLNLELKSGDGLSGDSEAKFNFYVDPDSMLIERIHGEQRMPDGASYQTTLEIAPAHDVEPHDFDDVPNVTEPRADEPYDVPLAGGNPADDLPDWEEPIADDVVADGVDTAIGAPPR